MDPPSRERRTAAATAVAEHDRGDGDDARDDEGYEDGGADDE
jgi:hypothetical protein